MGIAELFDARWMRKILDKYLIVDDFEALTVQ
jgi:hypothetical protein